MEISKDAKFNAIKTESEVKRIPFLRHAKSSSFKSFYEPVEILNFLPAPIMTPTIPTMTRVVRPKPVFDKEN